MTVLPERDIHFHLFCLMVADDLEARDLDYLSTDTSLVFYFEFSYRLIFSACLSLHPFEFFCFLDHFLCDESELTTFMSKHIGLVFVGLDLFVES